MENNDIFVIQNTRKTETITVTIFVMIVVLKNKNFITVLVRIFNLFPY